MSKIIFLPKKYSLVVGDEFQLFYRGIIKLYNPYNYHIKTTCKVGNPFPRYFSYTPKATDNESYELNITVYDENENILDSADTTLYITNPKKPDKKYNILCIGDSLTSSGAWVMEGYRRFSLTKGNPEGLGFTSSLNLLGTCKKKVEEKEIGYEGYGSWTWKSFCTNEIMTMSSPVWIEVANHCLDESDQHSKWMCNGYEWILETIEDKRLKFKRGEGNYRIDVTVNGPFTHKENAIHQNDIIPLSHNFEEINPFWINEDNDINFKKYAEKHNYPDFDFVYILLTWNGLYRPMSNDFSNHEPYARKLIEKIHESFKNAQIRCLGIQLCSVNGGIASNYGAHGPYSDWYSEVVTVFNYNTWLESLCSEYPYCDYVDVKGQFDTEYNMPYMMKKVNTRSEFTEMIGTNGVHPNLSGYLQIGDVFYRSLVYELCKNTKKENIE